MTNKYTLAYLVITFLLFSQSSFSQIIISLDEALDSLVLNSSLAQREMLSYENETLSFENYKKSFLPSLEFKLNPLNFNRSLRLLQSPADGEYRYVENYSNSSNAGLSIHQKIALIKKL